MSTPTENEALIAEANAHIAGYYWELLEDGSWPKTMKALVGALEAAEAKLAQEVTTEEELHALPVDSVIRDSMEQVYEKLYRSDQTSKSWGSIESESLYSGSDIELPARVLFSPDLPAPYRGEEKADAD